MPRRVRFQDAADRGGQLDTRCGRVSFGVSRGKNRGQESQPSFYVHVASERELGPAGAVDWFVALLAGEAQQPLLDLGTESAAVTVCM